MGFITDKFQEVKTLINEEMYAQASDECSNGALISEEAKQLLDAIINKLEEAVAGDPTKLPEVAAETVAAVDSFIESFLG